MPETSTTGASERLAPREGSQAEKAAPASSKVEASFEWPRDMNAPSPPASVWGSDPKGPGDA